MFSILSRQERLVVSGLAIIFLVGSILRYGFKKYPHLHDIVNIVESNHLYSKVNINTADFDELVAIPFIGPVTANSILEHREKEGLFKLKEELRALPGVRAENFDKFSVFIEVK